MSTLVEIGKTRNLEKTEESCFQFHTISHFSNSTRVDITVYQHGECFIFLKYSTQ